MTFGKPRCNKNVFSYDNSKDMPILIKLDHINLKNIQVSFCILRTYLIYINICLSLSQLNRVFSKLILAIPYLAANEVQPTFLSGHFLGGPQPGS